MKPILFNTEMVRAILEGRKTCTRRVIKENLIDEWHEYNEWATDKAAGLSGVPVVRSRINTFLMNKSPYQRGDILYVRETWAICYDLDLCSLNKSNIEHQKKEKLVWYRADGEQVNNGKTAGEHLIGRGKWRPSIHMPKKLARIFLKVINVRVERLQDITEESAKTEGINPDAEGLLTEPTSGYRRGFKYIWNKLYKNWDENPWIWVIEFERIEK